MSKASDTMGAWESEIVLNLGGSNVDVQLLSSHMEYEFNIMYLTIFSLLRIHKKVFLQGIPTFRYTKFRYSHFVTRHFVIDTSLHDISL